MTELWLVDVERSALALAELEREAPRLTAADHRRARALKDAGDRRQRLTITIALRLLLERAVGPEVARQPFVASPSGKPGIADGRMKFSLSHIEGYALIGLADSGEIGVDLERERPIRISSRRREELIAAAAGLAGKAAPGSSPDACFLQAWCRLEAFAKAHGQGIGRTLADLGLRSGRSRTPSEIEAAAGRIANASRLTVRDLRLDAGLYAAVAAENAGRLRQAWLPEDRAGLQRLLTPRSLARPSRPG